MNNEIKSISATKSIEDLVSAFEESIKSQETGQKWKLDFDNDGKKVDLTTFWTRKPDAKQVRELRKKAMAITGEGEEIELTVTDFLEKTKAVFKESDGGEKIWNELNNVYESVKTISTAFFKSSHLMNLSKKKLDDIISRYKSAHGVKDPEILATVWEVPQNEIQVKPKEPSIHKDIYRKAELDKLKSAFHSPYKDDGNQMTEMIQNTLQQYAETWNSSSYYAPYTTIAQSSGTGKSRTIKALMETENVTTGVFFICFRQPGSNGYPLRSYIADFLTKDLLTMLDKNFVENKPKCQDWVRVLAFYCAFLNTCVARLAQKINNGEDWKGWLQTQFEDDEDSLTTEKEKNRSQGFCMGREFWRPIIEDSLNLYSKICEYAIGHGDTDSSMVKCAIALMYETAKKFPCNECPLKLILFAFDEAGELLDSMVGKTGVSYFHYLRYALATFPPGQTIVGTNSNESSSSSRTDSLANSIKFFAVMIDTQTRISEFSPVKLPQASLRYVNSVELYEPIYLVGWWNNELPEISLSPGDTKNSIDSKLEGYCIKAGRYLWQSLGKGLSDCIVTAAVKLLNSFTVPENLEIKQCMALLGARYCVFFNSSAAYLPDLCRSHLASVFALDRTNDKGSMIVGYPSEPIVALASAMMSQVTDKCSPKALIHELNSQIKKGAVEAGYRGELTAKFLLLLARDSVVFPSTITYLKAKSTIKSQPLRKNTATSSITVREFLRSLGGEKLVEAVKLSRVSEQDQKDFLDGLINLNHFSYVTESVSRKKLKFYFFRGQGIFCKRGQTGCDFIIPVLLFNTDANMWVYSYVLISVKNYSRKSTEAKVASVKTSAEKVGIAEKGDDFPYMILFMDVGKDLESKTENLYPNPTRMLRKSKKERAIVLGIHGLSAESYPFLESTPELLKELIELSTAWMDPMACHEEKMMKRVLAQMMYGTYWKELDSISSGGSATVAGSREETETILVQIGIEDESDSEDSDKCVPLAKSAGEPGKRTLDNNDIKESSTKKPKSD